MTRYLYSLLFACMALTAKGQSTVGLIAHWDMNGTVNDVSGHGHNGTAYNIVSDTGKGGVPNTGYYFNGVNSYITVPYAPTLNLSQYTLCATVKVSGYYTAACHANMIFTRGAIGHPGNYSLYFYDIPYTVTCTVVDTTKNVFVPSAGGHTMPASAWIYTPTITKTEWYKVVATWDGTRWKVYVNDTLKANNVSTGGLFGTSTDSISIGMDIFETPYNFKGIIDDIYLYSRVLSDSEIVHQGDTCGSITLQPVNVDASEGGGATYVVNSTIPSTVYQWQQNTGTGFLNLANGGPYSGVTTNTLTITGATSAMNSYVYRCALSNSWGCADTSSGAVLYTTVGIDDIFINNPVSVYPDPAQGEITVQSKNIKNITIIDVFNRIVFTNEYNTSKVQVGISDLPAGLYFIRVNGSVVNRFIKQ